MMVRCVGADRERKTMTIDDSHDLHALAAFRGTDPFASPFGGSKGRVDEALRFVDAPLLAQRVRQIGEDVPKHLVATPALETTMHGLVVWKTLREHVPLGARVQNPKHRFQDVPRRDWFAPRTTVRNVFFWEMIAD